MEFDIIQGVPNDDLILLPVEWITSGATNSINKIFRRQNVVYILTKHMVVFSPAANATVVTNIDNFAVLGLGAMTNALNIDFPIEQVSRGARLVWTASNANSRLSVSYQKILLKSRR